MQRADTTGWFQQEERRDRTSSKRREENRNTGKRSGQINVRTEEECVGGTDDGYKMCEDPRAG